MVFSGSARRAEGRRPEAIKKNGGICVVLDCYHMLPY